MNRMLEAGPTDPLVSRASARLGRSRPIWHVVRGWFDAGFGPASTQAPERVDWPRLWPFIGMHLGCLLAIPAGISTTAVLVALALYAIRMFAITGFYHRYFSHRSFRTSRAFQFVMGFVGALSAQRGPIWWAAHHRRHHRCADTHDDLHSPMRRGFWQSHMGWFATVEGFTTHTELVHDLTRFPELRLLDRFNTAPPLLMGAALWGVGAILEARAPGLGVDGFQLFVWGFFVSTVVLYHATYTINSLAHLIGSRRFPLPDTSRNNLALALLTFGEGWHNNHHRYPHSVRQGFLWWEVDITWYGLRLLEAVGLISDLRPVPTELLAEARRLAASRIERRASSPEAAGAR